MLNQKSLSFLLLLFISTTVSAIEYEFSSVIKWNSTQKVDAGIYMVDRISFDDAYYYKIDGLPFFIDKFPIHTSQATVSSKLKNEVFIPLTFIEEEIVRLAGYDDTLISVNSRIVMSRKEPMTQIELIPIRWNASKHIYEKLVEFDIVIDVVAESSRSAKQYASSSVLSSGQWFKIKLNKNGIYKVSYSELSSMGFDMSTNPSNIAVFGNGGGNLPEKNDVFRYDDLIENPIVVVGGEDGSFDQGDYILFYGEGPVVWNYNAVSKSFIHKTNYYSDYTYYFLTSLSTPAKRITNAEIPSGNVDIEINDFNDYAVHEIDERNIAGIGRTWYGEIYDYNTEYEFVFDFNKQIWVCLEVFLLQEHFRLIHLKFI